MKLKHGKRLKRRHKKLLSSQGHDCKNYLSVKDTLGFMEFVNRETGKTLVIEHEK